MCKFLTILLAAGLITATRIDRALAQKAGAAPAKHLPARVDPDSTPLKVFGGTGEAQIDLLGTWKIVSRPTGLNTCSVPAEKSAYQWLVAENRGRVTARVLGETSFPDLAGRRRGPRFTLEGAAASPQRRRGGSIGEAPVYATSVFRLQVGDEGITGTRLYLGTKPSRPGKTGRGAQICVIEYDIVGKR